MLSIIAHKRLSFANLSCSSLVQEFNWSPRESQPLRTLILHLLQNELHSCRGVINRHDRLLEVRMS